VGFTGRHLARHQHAGVRACSNRHSLCRQRTLAYGTLINSLVPGCDLTVRQVSLVDEDRNVIGYTVQGKDWAFGQSMSQKNFNFASEMTHVHTDPDLLPHGPTASIRECMMQRHDFFIDILCKFPKGAPLSHQGPLSLSESRRSEDGSPVKRLACLPHVVVRLSRIAH
jgi:hypothetical protein